MALLFTVVLSVRPSQISQSHNPLFFPTEAQSVCKWTWVMADKARLMGAQGAHAVSSAHLSTHIQCQICARRPRHKRLNNRERKRRNTQDFFGDQPPSPSLSVLSVILCDVTL